MLEEHTTQCPYCGEHFTTFVDISQGSHRTVEDCFVCCRPIEFVIEVHGGEIARVDSYTDDETAY